jgi:hypothetical protein
MYKKMISTGGFIHGINTETAKSFLVYDVKGRLAGRYSEKGIEPADLNKNIRAAGKKSAAGIYIIHQ